MPARTKPAIAEGLLDYAAGALAGLIDNARRQAIADGVRPIPPAVYRSLLGYFPAALLQKCRYTTGCCSPLTLPAIGFSYGDPTAITVGDVVQFKNERAAQSEMRVWAHALTHVMQYQRWGIEGFAERYVRETEAVEQEAVENAERFTAWFAGRGVMPAGEIRPSSLCMEDDMPRKPVRSADKSSMATFR